MKKNTKIFVIIVVVLIILIIRNYFNVTAEELQNRAYRKTNKRLQDDYYTFKINGVTYYAPKRGQYVDFVDFLIDDAYMHENYPEGAPINHVPDEVSYKGKTYIVAKDPLLQIRICPELHFF